MSKQQEKPSALKREHPALQKMKFYIFSIFVVYFFCLMDPDLDPDSGSGYGSSDPLNPDPQHCFKELSRTG
jgi:hypothetical protein